MCEERCARFTSFLTIDVVTGAAMGKLWRKTVGMLLLLLGGILVVASAYQLKLAAFHAWLSNGPPVAHPDVHRALAGLSWRLSASCFLGSLLIMVLGYWVIVKEHIRFGTSRLLITVTVAAVILAWIGDSYQRVREAMWRAHETQTKPDAGSDPRDK